MSTRVSKLHFFPRLGEPREHLLEFVSRARPVVRNLERRGQLVAVGHVVGEHCGQFAHVAFASSFVDQYHAVTTLIARGLVSFWQALQAAGDVRTLQPAMPAATSHWLSGVRCGQWIMTTWIPKNGYTHICTSNTQR
ncbi:hypothetical protein [Rubripirellula amarantea]|uniref:hypothetical protein n=1 Tax=Rubripirellula amarantea TaxID=2527999 RepID=UPI0013EEF998|nr:hypothetical protein [Rubripirellula amarantea]